MAAIIGLCVFAFLAGFIDSVVGGGGLVQLPALFIFLPHTATATLFGTNKLSSIAGTTVAVQRYSRHVPLDWRVTGPAAAAAFVFSFLGARLVTHLDPNQLRPIILVLLIAVAIFTFVKKDFGALHAPKLEKSKQLGFSLAVGIALGFYDGFFGPGTGSFLIFAFVGVFGFGFLAASASSKVVNLATNLSAVLYFALTDHVLYGVGLPMAVCNVLGAFVGTQAAILKGSPFVRRLFLTVIGVLIVKFACDTFSHH